MKWLAGMSGKSEAGFFSLASVVTICVRSPLPVGLGKLIPKFVTNPKTTTCNHKKAAQVIFK